MKIRLICALAAALMAATVAEAKQKEDVRVVYGVDFDMNFDNREFYRSSFSESMTIFGARLTPSIGLAVEKERGTRHSIVAGIDVMKDFGAQMAAPKELLREPTLYYRLEKDCGKMDLELYAGVFPRKKSEGKYSEAFFSDSLKFYDNNLEGLLVKFKLPKAYFEVGCDWMGQFGQTQRERFMIYSSGEGKVASFLTLGYSGYVYHFAGCTEVRGVVDNILANPYARFDFGKMTDFQTLSFRLGWLQALQNDRRNIGQYTRPYGAEFDFEIRKWNAGVRNSMFYGRDMMPYYNYCDAGGYKYGTRLYFGDPFYRVHDDADEGPGMYDRFEIFWNPYVSDLIDIKVRAIFHYHGSNYSGCQQVVSLNFNLDRVTKKLK